LRQGCFKSGTNVMIRNDQTVKLGSARLVEVMLGYVRLG
jgi:hypothetical protein